MNMRIQFWDATKRTGYTGREHIVGIEFCCILQRFFICIRVIQHGYGLKDTLK